MPANRDGLPLLSSSEACRLHQCRRSRLHRSLFRTKRLDCRGGRSWPGRPCLVASRRPPSQESSSSCSPESQRETSGQTIAYQGLPNHQLRIQFGLGSHEGQRGRDSVLSGLQRQQRAANRLEQKDFRLGGGGPYLAGPSLWIGIGITSPTLLYHLAPSID